VWWSGVFAGVFAKTVVQDVVFWWSDCGVLRGKRGGLAVTFFSAENPPPFSTLFF
jgi:hypothetical protein